MAVSQTLAQAILESGEVPDIVGRFDEGQRVQRENEARIKSEKARAIQGQIVGQRFSPGSQLAELAGIDPAVALQTAQALNIPTDQPARLKQFAERLQVARAQARTDPQGAIRNILQFRDQLNLQGIETPSINSFVLEFQRDPLGGADSLDTLGKHFEGMGLVPESPETKASNAEDLREEKRISAIQLEREKSRLRVLEAKKKAEGGFGGKSKSKTGAFRVKNKETGEISIAVGVFDPTTGLLTTETSVIPGGDLVSAIGETPTEQTSREIQEERDKAIAKGKAADLRDLVTRGTLAAESTAVLRRGMKLLESIETGGIDTVRLSAKRLFGIETADEGELASGLGKAVLSQLRETFGAQFTEAEGARLTRIEGNLGKSPAANRRLLKQALAIAERTAERAMGAARRLKDNFAVKDIEELLAFELTGEGVQVQPAPVAAPAQTAEGTIAVNPTTGERLQFTNGQWVPVQ